MISNCHGGAGLARLRCAMARKCEEDVVPETKANFGAECKSSSNSCSSNNGSSGNVNATTGTTIKAAAAVLLGSPAAGAGVHKNSSATDRGRGGGIIGGLVAAMSPKLDDDADDILSMSLNKIDSPPPPRSVSRTTTTKGSSNNIGSSNSNSSNSAGGGVEDLVRRKSNALSKVQSKSDSPLDGATLGSSGGGGSASGKSSAGAAGSASGGDLDGAAPAGDDLCSTDEVKVFKDEGDRDDEKMSVEHNLLEEKSSLIDFTENEVSCDGRTRMTLIFRRSFHNNNNSKMKINTGQFSSCSFLRISNANLLIGCLVVVQIPV